MEKDSKRDYGLILRNWFMHWWRLVKSKICRLGQHVETQGRANVAT